MADFDFSTLITDRAPADLEALRDLLATPMADWTAEQLAQFNLAASKGAYNYTDLNRVTACMEYLNEQLRGYGYQTGYSKVMIPHKAVSALPDGYTELAYIESSGTQYVDTGFKPNNNTRAVADFEFTATNPWRAVFAARDANLANSFSLEYIGGAFRSDYGSDTSQQFPMEALGRRIYDKDRETTTIDGTSQSYANTPFQCGHNLCLWALNNNGEIKWLASGKLYSCQIYDNGTLVRDYVPCRSPEGEAGLYDLVNDAFYGNAGTGDFIAGPEPVELPGGYTQVEYIESSGTQYIDTGFKQNQNSRIVMSAQVTQQPSTHAWLFEGRISTRLGGKSVFLLGGAVWNADYNGGGRRKAFPDIGIFDALSIDFDKNSLQINEDSFTWTTLTFQSTANLALLACNTAGAISGYISAKLYNCQIYDNGALVRNFVPCQDPTGNVGLYDLVGAQFYGNAGTGAFVAGPEITPEPGELLDPYTWYEADIPTASQMAQYLENVSALRGVLVLPKDTDSVPTDMMGLTLTEANNIESILDVLQDWIINMQAAWFFSGDLYSGEA